MQLFRKLLVCSSMLACLMPLSWAQTRTVSVSVSRSTAISPDQALYTVSLQGGTDLTLDQVVAAVQSIGLSSQDLTSIATGADTIQVVSGGVTQGPPLLQYNFLLSANASQMSSTLASLAALGTALAKQNAALRFGFQLAGLQASTARIEDARQKATPDLLTEARRRANLLAAAGSALGGVRSLQDSSYVPGTNTYASFLQANSSSSTIWFVPNLTSATNASAQQVTFTLNVTFDLQ